MSLWLSQSYHKHRTHFSVESNIARQLVDTASGNIEKLLANRSQALKVSIMSASWCFLGNELVGRWISITSLKEEAVLVGKRNKQNSNPDCLCHPSEGHRDNMLVCVTCCNTSWSRATASGWSDIIRHIT